MDVKHLRKVVKAMVRECINEVLAEKFLEQRVNEHAQPKQSAYRETVAPATNTKAKPSPQERESFRRMLRERIGFDDEDPMASVFENTMSVEEREKSGDKPKISENVMKEIGIFDKDWSKYI